MLTTKQLEHALRVAYWADDDEGQDFLQAEISRRTHGPFTLAEAVASGYIRRPCWTPGFVMRISPGGELEYSESGSNGRFTKAGGGLNILAPESTSRENA